MSIRQRTRGFGLMPGLGNPPAWQGRWQAGGDAVCARSGFPARAFLFSKRPCLDRCLCHDEFFGGTGSGGGCFFAGIGYFRAGPALRRGRARQRLCRRGVARPARPGAVRCRLPLSGTGLRDLPKRRRLRLSRIVQAGSRILAGPVLAARLAPQPGRLGARHPLAGGRARPGGRRMAGRPGPGWRRAGVRRRFHHVGRRRGGGFAFVGVDARAGLAPAVAPAGPVRSRVAAGGLPRALRDPAGQQACWRSVVRTAAHAPPAPGAPARRRLAAAASGAALAVPGRPPARRCASRLPGACWQERCSTWNWTRSTRDAWRMLCAGQELHAGGQAGMGCGQYRIETV